MSPDFLEWLKQDQKMPKQPLTDDVTLSVQAFGMVTMQYERPEAIALLALANAMLKARAS